MNISIRNKFLGICQIINKMELFGKIVNGYKSFLCILLKSISRDKSKSICLKRVQLFNKRTAQKMKFSVKDFFSKCDQFPADLVTFTEKIFNGKLHFLCGDVFTACHNPHHR